MNTVRQGLVLLLFTGASTGSAQPETAPPPREKLPSAPPPLSVEFLVGQWKLVKSEPELAPGLVFLETFTRDGKNITEKSYRGENRRSTRRYKLDGGLLDLNPDGGVGEDQKAWFRVEVRDKDHMVLRGLGQFSGITQTFQRLPERK